MNAEEDRSIADWWRSLITASGEKKDAIDNAYQQLMNAGVISKVTVHQYRCRKGCSICTVIRVGQATMARTTDYKLGPGSNADRSVESARIKNTLDGNRHWPGQTFDVDELASWGPVAAIDMNCRHGLRTVRAVDILATVAGVRPGHPGKPTLF